MKMSNDLKARLLGGEESRNDLELRQVRFQRKEITADELVSYIASQTKGK